MAVLCARASSRAAASHVAGTAMVDELAGVRRRRGSRSRARGRTDRAARRREAAAAPPPSPPRLVWRRRWRRYTRSARGRRTRRRTRRSPRCHAAAPPLLHLHGPSGLPPRLPLPLPHQLPRSRRRRDASPRLRWPGSSALRSPASRPSSPRRRACPRACTGATGTQRATCARAPWADGAGARPARQVRDGADVSDRAPSCQPRPQARSMAQPGLGAPGGRW